MLSDQNTGLLGLQFDQLREAEGSCVLWQADHVDESGVLAALSLEERSEHVELCRIRRHDRPA